ncbi:MULTISPECIES: DUF4365 domain-containing protein [Rhizobium/Agrobacterium group]|jgi:hypothetical protein|uniref:DUF4365 domain-containing protein n=1 Tax=Rhizobium/Agrobacterium group TaxID=227290 RepID=UPI002168AC3E|nr:DUF4365 domain-containing protein [Rhizobium sp. BIGb0125]MCS4242666.1 hypothetical protein [Rhizobium sp. BIGb0125]
MVTAPYSVQSARQGLFSISYVRAVAAAAGCGVAVPEPDDDKVDVTISSRVKGTVQRSPLINIQVKCQASGVATGSTVPYVIDADTYESLIDPYHVVPRILVVVLVPNDMQTWLNHNSAATTFRHCGYWVCLKNEPPLPIGQGTRTIHLPIQNRFDPFQLQAMMQQVADGKDLTQALLVGGVIQ